MRGRRPDLGGGAPQRGEEEKSEKDVKIHKFCEPIFRLLRGLKEPIIQDIRDVAVDLNSRVVNMYGTEEAPKVPTLRQIEEAQGFCQKLITDINQLFIARPDLAYRQPLQEIVEYVDQILRPQISDVSNIVATERVVVSESPILLLAPIFDLLVKIKDSSIRTRVGLVIRHINRVLQWIDEAQADKKVNFKDELVHVADTLDHTVRHCLPVDNDDMDYLKILKQEADRVISAYLDRLRIEEEGRKDPRQRRQEMARMLLSRVKIKQKDGSQRKDAYTFKGGGAKKGSKSKKE